MSKANLPKYVKWRDGRPRWELGGKGGKRLREAGWSSLDLKDALGNWLSFEGAQLAGQRLNAAVTSWRAGADMADLADLQFLIASVPAAQKIINTDTGSFAARPASQSQVDQWSFHQLFEAFLASEHVRANTSAKTRDQYAVRLRVLGFWIGPSALSEMRASLALRLFERLLDVGYYRAQRVRTMNAKSQHRGYHDAVIAMTDTERDELREARLSAMEDDEDLARQPPGYNTSYVMLSTARTCWNWAKRSLDLSLENPFARLNLATPKGRIRFVTDDEVAHIVATADAMGKHQIGTACILARETVQRRADLCAMSWSVLFKGDWSLTQQKTNKHVSARSTTLLLKRLERAWQMETQGAVTPDPNGAILGMAEKTLTNQWRQIVNEAAKTMPSLTGVMLHDMRDTGFTRLLLAGNDLLRACQISGHSIKQGNTIERHYLGQRRELADQAVDVLDAYNASKEK